MTIATNGEKSSRPDLGKTRRSGAKIGSVIWNSKPLKDPDCAGETQDIIDLIRSITVSIWHNRKITVVITSALPALLPGCKRLEPPAQPTWRILLSPIQAKRQRWCRPSM